MKDYPLIAISQVARVTDLSFFGATRGKISLDVRGREFTGTSAVLVNGHRSPTFVVLSDARLLADIPTSVSGNQIRSINVLKESSASTSAAGTVISFESIPISTTTPSSSLLVQKVLKILLTTRGTDIFSPQLGGDLQTLVGSSQGQGSSVASYAKIYVQQAVSDMIQAQASSSAPMEEKVQDIEVISAEYNEAETSLDLRIAIISMAGQRVVAGLSI